MTAALGPLAASTVTGCLHCGKPTGIAFVPGNLVVCGSCADDYQAGVVENMRQLYGGAAFRCEKCGTPTLGDPKGAKLCDPCEDALHAEALGVPRG